MPGTEQVVARHDPCAWLPRGGVAEVVLTTADEPPAPTSVVRLLVTGGRGVLVVPRPDGRGPDLPTAPAGSDPTATVRELCAEVVGPGSPRLLGFVRNHVVDAPPSYPWPAPLAHFAVWHLGGYPDATDERVLPWALTADRLGERHWWPLLR